MIAMAKIVQVVSEQVSVTDSVKVTVHRAEPPTRTRINWRAWISVVANFARLIIEIIGQFFHRDAVAMPRRSNGSKAPA